MGTFINNNRGKLSLIAIAVAILLAWLASWLIPQHENLSNWLIFVACLFVLGRINFVHFSDAMLGKNHSEKTKKLWSEKRKGRRQAGKLVINLTTGVFYRSAIEAFETLGFGNLNSFKNRLRGTTKNNTGFIYV